MLHTYPSPDRLRALRRRALLTQRDVVSVTGVAQSTVSEWECGRDSTNGKSEGATVPRWTPPPAFPDRRHWLYMLGLGGPKGRATIRRRGLLDPRLSDAEFKERVIRWSRARAAQMRGRERREETADALRHQHPKGERAEQGTLGD